MAYCSCMGGNDPNCEVHGKKDAEMPVQTQVEMAEGPYKKKDVEDYEALLREVKYFKQHLDDLNQAYPGFMVIAVNEDGRVFTPMFFETAQAYFGMPNVLELVAAALRKRDVQ